MNSAEGAKGWAGVGLGANLKRLRNSRGWSQDALGKRAGVAQSRIRAIETGETAHPRTDTVAKLAEALGVTPAELTGDAAPGGMAEEEAAPFERAEMRDLVYRLAPRAGHPTAFRIGQDLPAFGLLAGDVAVIDLQGRPRRMALVVVTLADPDTGAARTVVRRYLPPVLLDAAAADATICDAPGVAIMGPICAVFRAQESD